MLNLSVKGGENNVRSATYISNTLSIFSCLVEFNNTRTMNYIEKCKLPQN